MPVFDATSSTGLSANLAAFIEAASMPGLGDGPIDEDTHSKLPAIVRAEGLQGSLAEAGLWLLAGDLERSHAISQDYESSDGSFWHGIMHRREGDFGNSMYWFRRVGSHPVHEELASQIQGLESQLSELTNLPQLSNASSLPSALVDACRSVASGSDHMRTDLEKICWWEWQLLFAHCT